MADMYCAVCRRKVMPDQDHVWIDAELRRIHDRNEVDDFAMHPECWQSISDGWMDPA